jgi:drug/metabolite transporter (DMT)-like permease
VTAVVLAAASAMVWGTADYCGGRASQRASALTVTAISQFFAVPVLLLCVLVLPGQAAGTDLLWGAAAGMAGVLGIVALYRSLSTGAMAVAAPITAVTGAVVPLAFGLAWGERPTSLALAGVGCAVGAIALVSLGHGGSGLVTPQVVGLALLAGTLFGLFFVLLAQSADGSGMWPLAAARCASIPLALLLVLRAGVGLRLPRRLVGWAAAAGAGDIAANALYLLAAREGLLSVVAPVAALYPVSTVLCAVLIDRETVRPVQVAGLGLAATALVLTAV